MNVEKGSDSGLVRIMMLGTALACGAMAASLQALQSGPGGFYFRVSWVSGLGFVGGTLAVLWLWKVLLGGAASPRQRLARKAAKGILLLSAVAAFLYPLRFVPKEKLPEIGAGLGLAVFVLSIVGWALWRIRRFLEQEEPEDQ
ncbi:MAG: hypothetical protein ACLQVY_11845 [Limisphaerales bacterium]